MRSRTESRARKLEIVLRDAGLADQVQIGMPSLSLPTERGARFNARRPGRPAPPADNPERPAERLPALDPFVLSREGWGGHETVAPASSASRARIHDPVASLPLRTFRMRASTFLGWGMSMVPLPRRFCIGGGIGTVLPWLGCSCESFICQVFPLASFHLVLLKVCSSSESSSFVGLRSATNVARSKGYHTQTIRDGPYPVD